MRGVGERTSGNRPGRHSRNDFVLRACLIMNPHPGEAPPPFARRTTTSNSSSFRGSSRRGGRVHGTARVKRTLCCRQLGGPLSVLIAPYITHAVFLITYFCSAPAELAWMLLISLAGQLHAFNWRVTSWWHALYFSLLQTDAVKLQVHLRNFDVNVHAKANQS